MREIDLRESGTGSYEFPLPGEHLGGSLCLNNVSCGDESIRVMTSYERGTLICKDGYELVPSETNFGAYFEFSTLGFRDLAGLMEGSITISDKLYCTETFNLQLFFSVIASKTMKYFGEDLLRHIKDVANTEEIHMLKAMVMRFLYGRLYMTPHILICKTPNRDARYEYSFYFKTDEKYPLTISIKLLPDKDKEGNFLEVIRENSEKVRFII